MLKCEFPEGCRLDLWAKVIKAKYIEKPKTTKRIVSDEARQEQMVRRRLMPWAVPTALATWLVLAFQFYQASNG